ncbi:MAG: GTP-binding protein, partial [Verrucomicrobiota bacterium]
IVTLCGFLGSGKTTLLRRWRRDEALSDAALIVHDLSEFGLDAELLSGEDPTPEAGHLNGRVAALHGSHAREKLHASVGQTLEGIAEINPTPPVVLCESTGAARPWPLITALTQNKGFYLRHFIVTVDALNLHRDFSDGRALTSATRNSDDAALLHAARVLAEQIAFASIIILTKTDTVSETVVKTQVATLQKIQPRATIGLSAQAGLLLPQLDATPAPKVSILKNRAEKLGLSDSASTVEDVDAIIFRDPRPFHPQRLYDVCHNKLSTGLYRTKGFLWLASRPADVLLWQQSGSQIALELTGYWKAEIVHNRDGKLLNEEVAYLKDYLKTQHPVFGDRRNELTLIGLAAARETFASALNDALCTDEEIEAWRRGEEFPDPWPKSLRKFG